MGANDVRQQAAMSIFDYQGIVPSWVCPERTNRNKVLNRRSSAFTRRCTKKETRNQSRAVRNCIMFQPIQPMSCKHGVRGVVTQPPQTYPSRDFVWFLKIKMALTDERFHDVNVIKHNVTEQPRGMFRNPSPEMSFQKQQERRTTCTDSEGANFEGDRK